MSFSVPLCRTCLFVRSLAEMVVRLRREAEHRRGRPGNRRRERQRRQAAVTDQRLQFRTAERLRLRMPR